MLRHNDRFADGKPPRPGKSQDDGNRHKASHQAGRMAHIYLAARKRAGDVLADEGFGGTSPTLDEVAHMLALEVVRSYAGMLAGAATAQEMRRQERALERRLT